MTIVGTAEILVHANTTPFVAEVEGKSRAALSEVEREAVVAGERTGAAMAAGVRKGTATMAAESRAAGASAGASLAAPIEHGATRSSTAMVAAGAAGRKAFLGASVAIVGAAGEGIHLAESMQTTEAAIAGAAGTSVAAAKRVGDALLGTAGKSEFSGQVQAKAYAAVAGQLKAVQGRALDAAEAEEFMRSAGDLAIAKQIDLGSAVGATASVLQGFGLQVKDAAHVTDVLFQASNATGLSVDGMATQLARLHSKLGDTAGSLTDVAGLLVDMTERGITGRAAMSAVNSGLNTLQKTAGGVTNAMKAQDDSFAAMPPALQKLVKAYQSGHVSATELGKATKVLTPEQKQLVTTFNSATGAVAKAETKYKSLGVEVFDSHGKFVGMDKVITQLAPKFAKMTQQQQLATATTIFGAGAARQMTAVINAGAGAYEKATRTVGKHNATQSAAEKQSKTMHRELQTLGATVSDVATQFGQVLVPAVTSVIHVVGQGTHFLLQHKTAAEALAVVIGGALSVAVGVFAVNKMGAMVKSVQLAGTTLKAFALTSSSVAKTVAGRFGFQATAAETSAAKIEASQVAERTAVTTTSATIRTESAATGASFKMVGSQAGVGAVRTETAVAGEATAVAAADTAIEAENVAAGASFMAMLPQIAAVVAAIVAADALYNAFKTRTVNATGIGSSPWTQIKGTTASKNLADANNKWFQQHGLGNVFSPAHTSTPTTSVPHIHIPSATAGLTAKQKKQLADIEAGGGGGGGGGGSTGGGSTIAAGGRTINVYSGLSKSERTFVANLANDTGLNARVISAWVRQEEGNRAHPLGHNDANWLNVGWTDKGPVKGTHLAAWQDPAQAAAMTAQWIRGTGAMAKAWGPASAGIRHILASANKTPAAQMAAIMGSGWASGGETALRQLYAESGRSVAVRVANAPAATRRSVRIPLYANPFAHAKGLHVGQTDMGVDYSMTPGSRIGAIGAGKVLGVTGGFQDPGGGNPNNGTYIAYELTEGPYKGKVVYVAEQVNSKVHKGQRLVAGQTIGTYASHGSGIEMGFAASASNWRQTLASAHGHGAYAVRHAPGGTIEGRQFSAMIHAIGKGTVQVVDKYGATTTQLSPAAKKLMATDREVAGQYATFAKWLAGQRAVQSLMTAAQKRALAEEIAIKKSALGVQTTREYAALTTQTKQQKAHLVQAGNDQKLASAMMNRIVEAEHSGSLRKLDATLDMVHRAGFDKLVARLSKDHITGFAELTKQLVKVEAAATEKGLLAASKKGGTGFGPNADSIFAGLISAPVQAASDAAAAAAQAIQDQTKITLDIQAEQGKTGVELTAAQAQTSLDTITGANNALIASAQQQVDKMAGDGHTETERAIAAANLAAAQNAAIVAEAQAQATLDIDNAAVTAAEAAASAAGAADAAASSITDARSFNFEIHGGGMTAAELFGEVGWALKTGALPVAAA